MPAIAKKKAKMIVKDGNGDYLQLLPETEVDAELDEESSKPVACSAVAESLSSIQSAASNAGAIKVMDEEPTALNTAEYTGETLIAWVQSPEIWSITVDTNQYSISTVHIPFSLYECPNTSITIDWGDGTTDVHTSENAVYNEYPQHSYSERGTYNITIESKDFNKIYIDTFYGDLEDNYVYGSSEYILSLKAVNSPLPKLAGVRLWNEQQNKAVNVDNSFEHLFYSCWVLESIPCDLFAFNSNATNFNACFNLCSSLQSIPSGLFDNCTTATSFKGCFSSSTSLQSIPSGLFDNNTAATDFSECFDYCTSLQSIPSGLFDNNTLVTDFGNCFSGCRDIQSIPSGLFDNNTAVTSFTGCFSGCYDIASIPSGLFDNNTLVTDFSYCFYDCSSLQSIPEGLFNKNTAVTSFTSCFNRCSSLQSIPSGLFDKNTAVTSFTSCFNRCSSLQSIPSGLFDKNTAVTGFGGCFQRCSSLQSIPEGLFDKNTAVTGFADCFNRCSSLADFTLHIGSSSVSNCNNFVTNKSGTTRTIYVPNGSTTQTTFNSAASSLGLTIIGE